MKHTDFMKAGFELLLWSFFLCSQTIMPPPVDWLAIRGAIVWLQKDSKES